MWQVDRVILSTTCLVFLVSHVWGAPSPTESWVYQAGAKIGDSPQFYPNASDPTHVVVVSQDGVVSLVDRRGKPAWKSELGGECVASVGIGELDGDESPEIVAGLQDGNVIALDAGGTERWRYKMSGRISNYRCPALADLDGDGRCEVILTDDQGYVVCLSNAGKRKWRFRIDPYYASPVAVADIDLDGEMEIVYGTERDRVVCLTAGGRLKWIRGIEGKFGRTAPTLGDVNGDGYLDVVVTMSFNTPEAKIYVLSGPTGEVLWGSPIVMWAYASNTIADLDRDGSPEIICCGRGRRIHVFNADGTLRWKRLMETGGFYKEAAVADLDGDGVYEILNGSRRGPGFEILSDKGTHLGTFGEGVCHVTPLVGDLDDDGKLETVVACLETGELTCFDLDAPASDTSVLWPSYRGDSANTGVGFYPMPASKPYKVQHAPVNLDVILEAPSVWGVNVVKIDWPTPLPGQPILEVAVVPKRGAARVDVLTLDLEGLPATISFNLEYDGRQVVTFTLLDGEDGRQAATASVKVTLSGRKSLTRWTESHLDELDTAAKELLSVAPDVSLRLRQMKAAHEATLSAIEELSISPSAEAEAGHDRLMKTITDLRVDTQRSVRLARVLAGAGIPKELPPVLMWADPNPWDEQPLWDTLEQVQPGSGAQLSAWMYGSEFEDTAVNLLNITPKAITVQVRANPRFSEHVDIRETVEVPRDDGSWVLDALPQLNAARTVTLPPGEVRQLWFVCNSRGLEAGTHDLPVELLVLGHENLVLPVNIRLEVAGIDLADAPPFMRCNWSSPGRIRSAGYSDKLTKPAVEAGMNVICMLTVPARKCDATGALLGDPDWSTTDHELSLLTSDCFLFISIHVSVPEGVKRGDAVWSKAFRAWADEVTEHLAAKGFPTSQWAIYPIDEPGLFDGPRLLSFMEQAVPVRAAAPDVPIYANPSGQITEDNFRDLVPYVDVWCPELGTLLRRPHMVDFFLADEGARVWSYEAPSRVKHLRPLGYYRSQSLIAFSLGLQGAGYWVHFYGDLWLDSAVEGYGANYASAGTWVESRRWLATRDGAEDARAYLLLQKLTREARTKGVASDACARAEELLEEELIAALERPIDADDVTRHVVGNYDPDFARLQAMRKQAGELTRILQRALGG